MLLLEFAFLDEMSLLGFGFCKIHLHYITLDCLRQQWVLHHAQKNTAG